MKKFDLNRALSGEPVVLRSGSKAYIRTHEKELNMSYPLIGVYITKSKAYVASWKMCGRYTNMEQCGGLDVVGMWHEPPVFEHWDLLREDVKYLAKDMNGKWYGYSQNPYIRFEDWDSLGYAVNTSIINPKLFPECEWKHSLIKRPEK